MADSPYYILSTDIGSDVDDALALLLALKIPLPNLLAIIVDYNPEIIDIRAKIAKKMCNLANRPDIIVAMATGESHDEMPHNWKFGQEGEGFLSQEDLAAEDEEFGIKTNGINTITKICEPITASIEIICIGPFSAIASIFKHSPKIKEKISKIWFMGAGIAYPDKIENYLPLVVDRQYEVNISHNLLCDIEAARVVLASRIPITFIGNDVTSRVSLRRADFSRFLQQNHPLTDGIVAMLKIWFDYRQENMIERNFGEFVAYNETSLHDPLTIAEAFGKEFCSYQPIEILEMNYCQIILKHVSSSIYNLAVTVDANQFENWFLDVVAPKSESE